MSATSFLGNNFVNNSTQFIDPGTSFSTNSTVQTLTVTGNLTVAGTTISQNNITIDDPLIRLGLNNNTGNIGILGEVGSTTKNYPSFLFDPATAKWTAWNGLVAATNTTLPALTNGYPTGTIRAQTLEAFTASLNGTLTLGTTSTAGVIRSAATSGNSFQLQDSVGSYIFSTTTGGATVFRTIANSINGFRVFDASSLPIFTVDTFNKGVLINTPTNNVNAFRVENAAGSPLIWADTLNHSVAITAPTVAIRPPNSVGNGTATFSVTDTGINAIFTVDTLNKGCTVRSPTTNNTNAFRVQNAAGSSLFVVDTSTTSVNFATNVVNFRDSTGTNALMVVNNATNSVNIQSATNSSTAFRVQNAAGASIINVDTTNTNYPTGVLSCNGRIRINTDTNTSALYFHNANDPTLGALSIGHCPGTNDWINGSVAGDVAFRFNTGKLLFGSGENSAFQILANNTSLFRAHANSTTAFQVMDASSNPQFTVNTTNGLCSMLRLNGTSATPTFTLGAGAGTGATCTISGNQMAGRINLTTGTTPTAGANVITLIFPSSWSTGWNPVAIITPAPSTNALANHRDVFISSSVATGFIITCWTGLALTASSTYNWNYHVIGG